MSYLTLAKKNSAVPASRSKAAPSSVSGGLRIGEPDDSFEQEADRVANEVMSGGAAKRHWSLPSPGGGGSLQRKCSCSGSSGSGGECEQCQQEKEEKTLQRKAVGPAESGMAPLIVREVLNSTGRPLDKATRDYFEPRFGYDFSTVRVHTGPVAHRSADEVNARAYTVGSNVVFGAGQLNPQTQPGRRLIAHELAHVLQSGGEPPVVRRVVSGDIRKQSISPQWIKALTDSELQQRADVLTQELQNKQLGSADRQDFGAKLSMLEEEASLRGVNLPAVAAYALLSVIEALTNDLAPIRAQLSAAGATQISFPGTKFSDVSGSVLKWGEDQLSWVTQALSDARNLIATAKAGGPQSNDQFRQAGTRYTAALFGAQALAIYATFVQTGATGKSYVPSMPLERILVRLFGASGKLDPSIKELKSLDAARVDAAAAGFRTVASTLESDYKVFVNEFDRTAANYQKFMQFYAVYQLVIGAIAGFRMTGGMGGGAAGAAQVALRLPGIGGITASGAATGINIVISAEWLEMIRRLGMTGAISIGMAGSAVGLAYPGQVPSAAATPVLLRATPSGSTTPSSGPDSGRSVSYGDSRNKHTKVANHTLQEMKDAVANPSAAPADLKSMQGKIGDPTYGSQLSKEATDNYAALVKNALENGARTSATRIDHTASTEVGINIINGQATKNYTMFYSSAYGGWHIFPR